MATKVTSICLFVAVSCPILTSVPSPKEKKKIRRAVLVVVFLKTAPFVFDMTTLLHLVGLIVSSVGNVVNNTLGQMPRVVTT